MTKKIYIEPFKKCPGSLYFTLLVNAVLALIAASYMLRLLHISKDSHRGVFRTELNN